MPTWTYAAVTGGTIWKRDVSLVTGDYIWQSIVITKSGVVINATNWENFYNTPICITGPEGQGGQPGTPGKGISNITIQYCNYGSGEPANTGSHWQDTIPTYDSSKPNYWTKTTITYTVGDPFIKKVLDQGITDAVYNSAMANSIAQSANENANGAMSQVVEVEQHLSVTDTNVSALQTRLKKIWINEVTSGDYVAGTYAASGIEGITFVENNPSTFGYNTLLRHNQLALRYNTINMTQLSTAALTFYRPTTINNQLVQGDRGLVINADELDILSISNYKLTDDTTVDPTKIYYSKNNNVYTRISTPSGNPHTNNYYEHDTDAKLDANGLILSKGGIKAGTAGQSGFIYLSNENYGSNLTINSHQASNWREIIGTKFGVDADGNLYASNAEISGKITVGSGSNVYTKTEANNTFDELGAANTAESNAIAAAAADATSKANAAQAAAEAAAATDATNKANAVANSAAYEEQYIYISKVSGTGSVTKNETWVARSDDVQNIWTTKRPTYDSNYPVLFIAKQKKTVGQSSGTTCSCTTPIKDDTITVIDGGHITTGTIDASKLNVTSINASGVLTIGALNSTTQNSILNSELADDIANAEANASYSIEVKITDINYTNNSATLMAMPYYQGSATLPTLPNGASYSYRWYKGTTALSDTSTEPTINGATTTTLILGEGSDLEAIYICVISKP